MRIMTMMLTMLVLAAVPMMGYAQRTGGRADKFRTEMSGKIGGAKLSETQQQNINKLKADLQAIKQGSQVTSEMKQALKNDLLAMADGATKPDPTLVQKLADDLAAAVADGNLDNKEKAQLSNDLYAVMNSAGIPASEVNQAIADAQAIIAASGVDRQDVQLIVADLEAIVAEARNNHPNAGNNVKGRTAGMKGRIRQ